MYSITNRIFPLLQVFVGIQHFVFNFSTVNLFQDNFKTGPTKQHQQGRNSFDKLISA